MKISRAMDAIERVAENLLVFIIFAALLLMIGAFVYVVGWISIPFVIFILIIGTWGLFKDYFEKRGM